MNISRILRQISYSFNANFLIVNFIFVKRKKKEEESKKGWGGEQVPQLPSPLGSATGFLRFDSELAKNVWNDF